MNKYKEEYSDNSNYMIGKIDRGLDGSPLPILAFDVDPTTQEICDSVDYLIKSNWLGNILFARKVTYTSPFDKNKTDIGVLFSDKENVFDNYEKCGFYYQDRETPMVIGLSHNGYKKNQYEEEYPNESVLIRQDDGTVLTRTDYKRNQNNKIKTREI